MKRNYYKTAILALLFLAAAAPPALAAKTTFRNISSYTVNNYNNSVNGKVTENAFVAKVEPDLSLVLRVYRDDRLVWANNIYTIGATTNVSKTGYIETTYGHGHDSNRDTSNHYAVDYTNEKGKWILGVGLRRSLYPGYRVTIVSPGALYYITPDFTVRGKVFYSDGSNGERNASWWTESEIAVSRDTKIKFGFTGGDRLYDSEYGASAGGSHRSWLTGISYQLNDRSKIKLIYENQNRKDIYKVKKSSMIYDVKF